VWRHQATPTYSVQRYAACREDVSYGRRRGAFLGKKLLSVCGGYRPGESLWVHSNGVNGIKPTFHRHANLSWLSKICNHFREIAAGSRKSLTLSSKNGGFWGKRTPYGQIFTNVFQSPTCGHGNTYICANFVKFGRPEVGEIARYLMDKKKQKFDSRSRCRFCTDRAQNLPWTAPNNILGVPQISSKSVHFRRSYSRTREHRSNAPQCLQYSAKLQLLRRVVYVGIVVDVAS